MKIRSLLVGSVAAAGLTTGGAYAADLGVLTSLDICDNLGLSGLTISSDTNCLQVTGEVKYTFEWGDYSSTADAAVFTEADTIDFDAEDGAPDWSSRFDAWIKFVATAESDFGPAKAVLKLKQTTDKNMSASTFGSFSSTVSGTETAIVQGSVAATGVFVTGTGTATGTATGTVAQVTEGPGTVTAAFGTIVDGGTATFTAFGGSTTDGVIFDEAYVQIGDTTVIMAGKKGSILNKGDDEPLNWLGLFNSEGVDEGVDGSVDIGDGGHVIQVTSDLGNGFSVAAGLENLDESSYYDAGSFMGVIAYAGDGISAHVSLAADGILAMEVNDWLVHAGFTGTFDNFKVVLAGAFDSEEYWNVLASASATFDMFTIAGSFEAVSDLPADDIDYGAGASISAAVTDGVTLNLGGRWYHDASGDDDSYEVAAQVEAAVTETLTVTGKVGYVDSEATNADLFYGEGKLAWNPGGGFTSSLAGKVNSDGGYKLSSEFKKTFE